MQCGGRKGMGRPMNTESKYLAAKVRYEKLAKSPKSVDSPGAKNKAWRTMRRLQKELEASNK